MCEDVLYALSLTLDRGGRLDTVTARCSEGFRLHMDVWGQSAWRIQRLQTATRQGQSYGKGVS